VAQSRTSLAESFIENQFGGILQQRREELEAARAALNADDSEENQLAAQQAEFNLQQLQAEIDSVTQLAVELEKGKEAGKGLNEELDGDGGSDPAPKITAATGSLNDLQAKLKEVTDQLSNADPNDTRLFTDLNQKAADLRKEIEIIQQRSQALTDNSRIAQRGRVVPGRTEAFSNAQQGIQIPVGIEVDPQSIAETEDEIQEAFDSLKSEVAALGGELDSVLGTNGLDALFDNLLVFFTDELPEDVKKGQAAFQAAAAGISVITGALNNFYSQQIASNEAYIDALNQRVDEQQSAIQQEQEAADAGRANNVESEQAALEQLQTQRRNALAEQEKLQRRQAAVQALQQAGALATTAAQLFASQAPKGIIGVGIAAGLLSTVLGLFSAFKQKSRAEVFAREGHAEILGGNLHTNGGTNLGFVEAERGEAFGILNRRASEKYGKDFVQLVDDLNNGRDPMPQLPDVSVRREPLREAMELSMSGGRRAQENADLRAELSEIKSLLSQWPHQVAVSPGDTIHREQGNKKQIIKIT
jgi:hypothetical protein